MICIAIISLGIYRLILMPISLFNIWMGAWMILPGVISLFWLSNRAVSVWATRELSTSAIEYGLKRNLIFRKVMKNWVPHNFVTLCCYYTDSNNLDI